MSSLVFPSYLPGIAWPIKRTPMFATHIQQALSGKESRIALKQYPQYTYEMDLSILRDDQTRTNFVSNSVSVASAVNGTATSSASTIDVLAPDGTYTAIKVTYAGGGAAGQSIFQQTTGDTATATASYVSSIYLRTSSGTLSLQLGNGVGGTVPITVTSSWQRFSVATLSATATSLIVNVLLASGSSAACTVYAWGAQCETGTVAGIYLPTYGTTNVVTSDYRTLNGFYTLMQGQWDTFLFQDPSWCTEIGQQFGTGDGTTTAFQLLGGGGPNYTTIGGFDLIQNLIPFSGLAIYVNGTLKTLTTDYSVGATGIITFVTAPAAAAVITWTGSYYNRCRFLTDEQEMSQMMNQWWEIKKLQFLTVKT